jgi:enoyl-CoA hydratase
MSAPLVSYEFSDGIATLTMDDGEANAMSVAMLQALNDALDRAQSDGAAVLLTGRAGMFSGGFDLAVFKRGPDELFRMLEAGARMTERLLSFPKPVVAACSGHAVAMGLFLLLSTDVRIGVDGGARLQANEVQIGLTLPHFAIEVCRQRLAPAHLHLVAATAAPYTPEQALAAGMLDELVPAASLAAVARERTAKLLMLNAEAFTATKLRLRADSLTALRAAIDADLADWSQRFRPT